MENSPLYASANRSLRSLPQPEPAAGVLAYQREREMALEADERKRKNYEKYLESRRTAAVDYLPIKLDIENVSRCNFRCTMCVVQSWPKGKRARDMTLDEFRRLLDDQFGLLEIKLQGVGEPLLQRDDFFEMIRYARERHIWVRTTTNASLLHLRNNFKTLIDTGINEVQISIDAATKDAYESIRPGSVFERVLQNCKAINGYCRQLGIERTKMWTVVQRDNMNQLGELVDLAAGLGFTNQVFSLELSDWAMPSMRAHNKAIDVEAALDKDALVELIERGRDRGVRVRFWNVTEKYRTDDPQSLCPWPFERAFVSSDGHIVPCCYIANPDVYQLGTPLGPAQSMSAIWKGPAYVSFREAHLSGTPPKVCEACYSCGTRAL